MFCVQSSTASCVPLGQAEEICAVLKLSSWWVGVRSVIFHVTILVFILVFKIWEPVLKKQDQNISQWELILFLKTVHFKCEWCMWVTHMKTMASCNKGMHLNAHGPSTWTVWKFMLQHWIVTVSFKKLSNMT